MRDTEVSYEAFRLGCRACGAQWRAVYRVQRWSDDGGAEHTAWYREGAGSVSPYGGECCDSCGATAEVAAPPWDIAHGRRVGGEAPEALAGSAVSPVPRPRQAPAQRAPRLREA